MTVHPEGYGDVSVLFRMVRRPELGAVGGRRCDVEGVQKGQGKLRGRGTVVVVAEGACCDDMEREGEVWCWLTMGPNPVCPQVWVKRNWNVMVSYTGFEVGEWQWDYYRCLLSMES